MLLRRLFTFDAEPDPRDNDPRGVREIGAIVFSRMGSSRLPGKALAPIGSRPLLGHVLDRVRRVRGLSGIALATSTDPADDVLAEFAAAESIPCWRGSALNVVERGAQCARWMGWDAFVRVCGDRVFLDPDAIDAGVLRLTAVAPEGVEVATNVLTGGVAPGLTVEVMRTRVLERILRQRTEPEDLEHMTRYVYRRRSRFRIEHLERPPRETEALRFVVDTPQDLERSRHIVSRLVSPASARLDQIVRLTQEWEQASLVRV